MIENKKTDSTQNARISFDQDPHIENRWEEDRRREPSEGFAYISSVGWIDRRERLRRKDDPYAF
jgi:hypothetical protein